MLSLRAPAQTVSGTDTPIGSRIRTPGKHEQGRDLFKLGLGNVTTGYKGGACIDRLGTKPSCPSLPMWSLYSAMLPTGILKKASVPLKRV